MQQGSTVPQLGSVLGGRYRVDALIGVGGMASVYRAFDTELGREVALKLFRPDAADAGEFARQRGEIELLARLNHPALVTLFDAGVAQLAGAGRAYFAMELVDGPELRAAFEERTLTPGQLAHLACDIAEALHYIHDRGIVHRDIKPANVLVAPPRLPGLPPSGKLTDFGIARLIDSARLTSTGTLVGTASYLSPEQALGETVAAPSDIYALGLVLLEGISGERAFPGGAIESALARTTRDPEIPAAVPAEWARLLGAMTGRAPGERPTAAEVATTLRSLESHPDPSATTVFASAANPAPASDAAPTELLSGSTSVMPTTEATGAVDAPRHSSRRRLLVASGALILLSALVVAVVVLVMRPAITEPSTPSAPALEYPAVPGPLGEHLGELQDAVTP
ncbi:serine/threonine protein kinase [Microterricola gilva]|uniref:Serine/threonine protein kinase n=1 Tax=Microterricola gilva TaxID=393267 RepID=A0A4Q8AS94_9MICO|nr:serine/threonine-protein kinase [Microterricola gilva]RZU67015.1 serine/threonine protein kinase [Microterricola gilva]